MGFSSSWFAVQGLSRDDLLTELSMAQSGQRAELPDFRVCVAELPKGWQLVWFDDELDRAFEAAVALPAHTTAVACAVEEHVMLSDARGYAGGAEAWRVTHDPNRGESLYHLETAGELPPQFAAILAAAKAEQAERGGEDAGVDFIFDVPTDLAKSICGFRHDDEPPEGVTFEELRRARPVGGSGKPGFFARLFGPR